MYQYKVLIVDDSAFMRRIISDLISEEAEFCVVATAKDGREAIEMAEQYKPDVITMDIEMPEMNGLDALHAIMQHNPTPVIMLSSLTHDGAEETLKALELGAIDFVKKPSGSISLDLYKVKTILIDKLKIAVTANLKKKVTTLSQKGQKFRHPGQPSQQVPQEAEKFRHLVAIGTSTGGPRALHQVISQLPGNFDAPLLVVQHMPPKFTQSLAQRLNSISDVNVVEAVDNSLIQGGTAYIAPGGWHMQVIRDTRGDYRIQLSKEDPVNGHRPSVDMLFESLIPFDELKRHIVIMTGMGSDGAKGMKMLKDAGAQTTIAESEVTCIVYGMPRAAIERDAVDHILPVQEIAGVLVELIHDK